MKSIVKKLLRNNMLNFHNPNIRFISNKDQAKLLIFSRFSGLKVLNVA